MVLRSPGAAARPPTCGAVGSTFSPDPASSTDTKVRYVTDPRDTLRTVSGDGVVLRAFADDDVATLVDLFADPEVARWNPGPTSLDEVRVWVERRNDWTGG